MEATLPARDFCYQHLADAALPPVIASSQRRPVSKALWLTLLASVLLHVALLLWWAQQPPPQAAANTPSLTISLATPVEETPKEEATEEIAPDTPAEQPEPTVAETPPAEEAITAEPPPAEPQRPPATELDLRLPAEQPVVNAQTDSPPHKPGAVFHPELREKIDSARTTRTRLQDTKKTQLTSWQDASGNTWTDLGNGTCMRSTGGEHGFTQNWELPVACGTQLTKSEKMLRNVQKAVDKH